MLIALRIAARQSQHSEQFAPYLLDTVLYSVDNNKYIIDGATLHINPIYDDTITHKKDFGYAKKDSRIVKSADRSICCGPATTHEVISIAAKEQLNRTSRWKLAAMAGQERRTHMQLRIHTTMHWSYATHMVNSPCTLCGWILDSRLNPQTAERWQLAARMIRNFAMRSERN